jgi:hypothetical protein
VADNVIEFLIKGDASDADKAFGQLNGAIGGVTKVLGALGIAISAVKLVEFVGHQIEVADQMGKMALKAGVAVDSFSQMAVAFDLSDVSAEELAGGFKFLNKAIDEAKQGNDSAIISFESIGLSMRDLKKDSPDEVLLKIADAFTQIEDPAARNTMLLEKFGRAGLKLAPAMEEGRAGIEKLMKQADNLGLTVDKEFAKAADQFGDSMQMIGLAADGVGRQLGKSLLPILQTTIDTLFDFGGTGGESILPWGKITVGIVGAVAAVLLSLVTIVKGVTTSISAAFKGTGEMIGASMAAIEQAVSGDFTGALSTLEAGWEDMGQTAQKAVSSIDDDLLKTGAAINKMDEYVQNYGQNIKKAGDETEAASKKPGLNPISKEAAGRLEATRKAFNAFLADMEKQELAASGNKLALLDAEYNKQVSLLNDLKLNKQQQTAAIAALDTAYAAQRVQLNDEMLSKLGIADEGYRARTAELIIQDGLRMEAAGLSQIEADKFVKTSLLEQQIAYLDAKNAALGEDYMMQDEITLARFEAESLRLLTSLELELITREQYNAAMIQAETNKQAKLGSIQAQAEAARLLVSKMTFQQQLAYTSTALDGITALMQTQSKEGFRIGKAAAIAQAVINTYTGATGAYASASAIPVVGWILGPLAAAAAIVLGMQNVSKIRGQQMGQAHAGMTNVPNEGTFLLDKGERVIQPEQNKDLTNFLAGGGGGGGQSFVIQNMEVHVLENATSFDALMKMSDIDLRELVAGKFYKAFNTLDSQGIRPNFVERYSR